MSTQGHRLMRYLVPLDGKMPFRYDYGTWCDDDDFTIRFVRNIYLIVL